MRDSKKIIVLQWTVIAALVIGGGIAGYMVVHKADELNQSNSDLTSSNDSLRQQLTTANAQLQASPSPSASPSATPSATPSTSPAASATPTVTPKP